MKKDAYLVVFRAVYNTLRRQRFAGDGAAEHALEATQHAFLKLLERQEQPTFATFQHLEAANKRGKARRVTHARGGSH